MTSKRRIVDGEVYVWTRRGWRLVRDGMIRTRRGWRVMQRRRIAKRAAPEVVKLALPDLLRHSSRSGRYDILRTLGDHGLCG